jgi:hypothetical protein
MPAALVLPQVDPRVNAALGRLATAAMIAAMPVPLRERLAAPLSDAELAALAADIDRMAGLLARGAAESQ